MANTGTQQKVARYGDIIVTSDNLPFTVTERELVPDDNVQYVVPAQAVGLFWHYVKGRMSINHLRLWVSDEIIARSLAEAVGRVYLFRTSGWLGQVPAPATVQMMRMFASAIQTHQLAEWQAGLFAAMFHMRYEPDIHSVALG